MVSACLYVVSGRLCHTFRMDPRVREVFKPAHGGHHKDAVRPEAWESQRKMK